MCSTVQEQITTCGQNAIVKIGNGLTSVPKNGHKVQALFVNVIYEGQVLYAKPKKRGPFRKNKTPLCGIEPFSNSIFYGAIVSNTQYSTSGGFIYSDNTNFYCIP